MTINDLKFSAENSNTKTLKANIERYQKATQIIDIVFSSIIGVTMFMVCVVLPIIVSKG